MIQKLTRSKSQLFFKTIQRVSNKIVPFDICHVLLLDLAQVVEPKTNTNHNMGDDRVKGAQTAERFEYRFLTDEDVVRFSNDPTTDLGLAMHGTIGDGDDSFRCFAALANGRLVGYSWIASGVVPPEHNSGGHRFYGIGLELEQDITYLFKCFVVNEYRGRGINKHLLWRLAGLLQEEGKTKIVTTTSWVNRAFQSSSRKIGFNKVGSSAEWSILGKHFFRWSQVDGVKFYQRGTTQG